MSPLKACTYVTIESLYTCHHWKLVHMSPLNACTHVTIESVYTCHHWKLVHMSPLKACTHVTIESLYTCHHWNIYSFLVNVTVDFIFLFIDNVNKNNRMVVLWLDDLFNNLFYIKIDFFITIANTYLWIKISIYFFMYLLIGYISVQQ